MSACADTIEITDGVTHTCTQVEVPHDWHFTQFTSSDGRLVEMQWKQQVCRATVTLRLDDHQPPIELSCLLSAGHGGNVHTGADRLRRYNWIET